MNAPRGESNTSAFTASTHDVSHPFLAPPVARVLESCADTCPHRSLHPPTPADMMSARSRRLATLPSIPELTPPEFIMATVLSHLEDLECGSFSSLAQQLMSLCDTLHDGSSGKTAGEGEVGASSRGGDSGAGPYTSSLPTSESGGLGAEHGVVTGAAAAAAAAAGAGAEPGGGGTRGGNHPSLAGGMASPRRQPGDVGSGLAGPAASSGASNAFTPPLLSLPDRALTQSGANVQAGAAAAAASDTRSGAVPKLSFSQSHASSTPHPRHEPLRGS
jgi:hypothetical protein